MKDRLENDIRELAGAEPAELARRLVERGWTHPGTPHPGQPHEFRTTCLLCGESGLLHVSLITRDEVVRVEASEPL
jgi:hypothetical protein